MQCDTEYRERIGSLLAEARRECDEARAECTRLRALLGRAAHELESSGSCSNALAEDICSALAFDATTTKGE